MKRTQKSLLSLVRRKRNSRSVITLFFVWALIICGHQSVSAQQQAQPGTSAGTSSSTSVTTPGADKVPPTGSIKGRVIGEGDRAPANTVVSVRPLNGASRITRTTRINAEGRFVFDDLPAAVYTVIATAPAHIDEAIASGDTSRLPLHLVGSQLRIRMIKGGVITGAVTNTRGDPVVGVTVSASLVGDQRDIAATFARETSNVETDDRGIYRIYGLPPGEYVVSAGGRGVSGRFNATGFELDTPTYYPSSTRDTAIPVTVRSGEEAAGIDIKYKALQGHSISGVILHKNEPSIDLNVFTVSLRHFKTDALLSMAVANTGHPHRSFSFDGVADGEYELFTTFSLGPTSNGLSGTKRVVVRGSDVTGVELSLNPLSSIQGSLKLQPTETEEKCDKRRSQLLEVLISVTSETPKTLARKRLAGKYAAFTNTVDTDNAFTMWQLEPGKFRFDITLPTDAWYLREIKLPPPPASKDTQQSPRSGPWQGTGTLKPGENISGVVITVGQDAAGLSGRVTLPKVMSVPQGLEVHLVPVDREHANDVLRYYETRVDSDRQFKVSHIAPGRYLVITRIRPAGEMKQQQNPAPWNPTSRTRLRREAETAKTMIELKGCQRLTDYALNMIAPP